MRQGLIDRELADRRADLSRRLADLERLALDAGHLAAASEAAALIQAAREPFLFVAVGEVKAGKSSFLNALLGSEVSAVAPDPCTDRILMISRGQGGRFDDSELFSRIELDHPMLQDLAVVDTPGVDSVVDRHQEITESFLPRCDLALFVFSALNPYGRSAWDFLELVAGRWRRKVVLVLTQADLATPVQLKVNRERVLELARERGMEETPVFVVSSALEAVQPELSGLEAVRGHIRRAVAGGEALAAKEASLARGALTVLEDVEAGLAGERAALETGQALAGRVRQRLAAARDSAARQAAGLKDGILRGYEAACREYLAALEMELSFSGMIRRSVLGFFRRVPQSTAMLAGLEESFRATLETSVERLSGEGAAALSQHLALEVAEIARQLHDLASREEGGQACPRAPRSSGVGAGGAGFKATAGSMPGRGLGGRGEAVDASADAFPGRREAVLRDVASALEDLVRSDRDAARLDPLRVARLDPKAAMGGLMVLVGGLFGLSVKGVVFDVTGGVLAGSGALLAGGVLAVGRPRLLRSLRENLDRGGQRLEAELTRLLENRLEAVFADIRALLAPFEAQQQARQEALADLEARRSALRSSFGEGLDTAFRIL